MSEADRLNMQPGSVILVPPRDGTYTPAPVTPALSATATATIFNPTNSPSPPTLTPTPTQAAASTLAIKIAPASTASAKPQAPRANNGQDPNSTMAELIMLSLAIMVQLVILVGASVALISRSR